MRFAVQEGKRTVASGDPDRAETVKTIYTLIMAGMTCVGIGISTVLVIQIRPIIS
jgi:hypothetical protein